MLRLKFIFSFKKSLKISCNRLILSSFLESTKIISFIDIVQRYNLFQLFFFRKYLNVKENREVANCVLKDMIHLILAWRHIRGYPQGGNTTHTNSNTSKKNKLLFNFRVNQYFKTFGQKKRNVYPLLVKAEYNNRLWYCNWFYEWLQAHVMAGRMAENGHKFGEFNPAILATNQTNGYKRKGKAAKMSKAKILTKTYTIGVPLFFARYMYDSFTPYGFPKIILRDEVNKKLGKKLHRREYRNKKK